MKKTLTSIITGIGLFGLISCGSIQKPNSYLNQKENIEHKQTENSLDQIIESVHCLRSKITYDDPSHNVEGHGTGFSYQRKDGYTYILTNQHVIGKPEILKITRNIKEKNGKLELEIKFKKIKRKKSLVNIVDFNDDKNPKDDISLELIYENKTLDLAVLRTKKKLKTLDKKYFGDSRTLKRGEAVYLTGYPLGKFSFVSDGIVGNPGKYPKGSEFDDKIYIKLLNMDVNFGNSGSPFFVKRNGKFYWMGMVGATFRYGIGVAIGSEKIRALVDYVIDNPNENPKNIGKRYGVIKTLDE